MSKTVYVQTTVYTESGSILHAGAKWNFLVETAVDLLTDAAETYGRPKVTEGKHGKTSWASFVFPPSFTGSMTEITVEGTTANALRDRYKAAKEPTPAPKRKTGKKRPTIDRGMLAALVASGQLTADQASLYLGRR
jgi:hypothetical protein